MSPVFIEAGLFDAAGLTDDLGAEWDGGHALRLARRLLALSWLLAGGVDGDPGAGPCRASVDFWATQRGELGSWRPATLTTILFQLEALGVVESFTEAKGGFHVQLTKELPL